MLEGYILAFLSPARRIVEIQTVLTNGALSQHLTITHLPQGTSYFRGQKCSNLLMHLLRSDMNGRILLW